MNRRLSLSLSNNIEKDFYIVSPEDIILLKLQWYKIGNCQSDRQWNDIMGVIKIQQDKLDIKYLKEWAVKLGVDALLAKALTS